MKTIVWVAPAAAAFGFSRSAHAAECTSASVSTYTAAGFSCTVGGVRFSDIKAGAKLAA